MTERLDFIFLHISGFVEIFWWKWHWRNSLRLAKHDSDVETETNAQCKYLQFTLTDSPRYPSRLVPVKKIVCVENQCLGNLLYPSPIPQYASFFVMYFGQQISIDVKLKQQKLKWRISKTHCIFTLTRAIFLELSIHVAGNWGNQAFPEMPAFRKSLRHIHSASHDSFYNTMHRFSHVIG